MQLMAWSSCMSSHAPLPSPKANATVALCITHFPTLPITSLAKSVLLPRAHQVPHSCLSKQKNHHELALFPHFP